MRYWAKKDSAVCVILMFCHVLPMKSHVAVRFGVVPALLKQIYKLESISLAQTLEANMHKRKELVAFKVIVLDPDGDLTSTKIFEHPTYSSSRYYTGSIWILPNDLKSSWIAGTRECCPFSAKV